MRLVMIGTGPFSVPSFRGLFEMHHTIVALVTSPPRMHRGAKVPEVSDIRDIANEHQIPIFDPESINTPESIQHLQDFDADLLIVCDYGQILSSETLATARLGGINLHGSLLPKYRGAAPVNWAIYHGESVTGVTVIHMTPKVDAGPCIAQAVIEIGPDETADDLEVRLAETGQWLVRRSVDLLEQGQIEVLPQNPLLASKAPRLKKADGAVDWSRTASDLKNQVRALEPWPRTFTYWHRSKGRPVRLILGPLEVVDPEFLDEETIEKTDGAAPGQVISVSGGRLLIATGSGLVSPAAIQPAGKQMMPIEQFLRGNRVEVVDRFGPESPD